MYRLDRSLGREAKEQLAIKLIADVGLKGKEDMHVGGPLPGGLSIPGLSGGEKRRLSLVGHSSVPHSFGEHVCASEAVCWSWCWRVQCCASVTRPSLLFLDEPTSGLDASAALSVVNLLRHFSDSGMMIM